MSIVDVISIDRWKKEKQKQPYYFIIFCCNSDALHVSSKSHNKKWSLLHLKCMFGTYLVCAPFPCNTLRYIFFYHSPLKSLGRVAFPYTLRSISIRNHFPLIWTYMYIIRTGGSLFSSFKLNQNNYKVANFL